MTNEEKFYAWLDGEISASEAAEMEASVAADLRLTRLAERHRALGARLRGAFDTVAAAPLPEQLQTAIRKPEAEIVDLAAVWQAREVRRGWSTIPQWAAMAATLAIGIVVGTMVPQLGSPPVEIQGSKIYAASALADALDTELASAPSNGPVRIGVSFRDQSGVICRSFTQPQGNGLACRDDGRWQVRGLFAAPGGQASGYRMAGGMDQNLAALIDSTIAGEPFDATHEKAARDKGWR